jgi:hypothetical protein
LKTYFYFLTVICFAPADAVSQVKAAPDEGLSHYANAELPGWLRVSGEDRVRFEGLSGVGFKPAGNRYLLERLRLNLDFTPLRWLKFSFQAQDSRVFFTNVSPAPSSQKNPLDLRLGYVQIGNSESGPVSVRAGRQGFVFGEGRLVADPAWSNVGRSFDGVRLTLRYRKVRVDTFTGVSDKVYTDGFDTPVPGESFSGVYASFNRVIPDATIDPYVFWRVEQNVKAEVNKAGRLDQKTVGFRWVGLLPLQFDYGIEMALQRGSLAKEPISAWAGHWVFGYTLADRPLKPKLFVELNRASGDHNTGDGMHGAFDPLFPSSHDKLGTADQFTWTNIVHARLGSNYNLTKQLKVAVAYDSFWLADRHDGIYGSGKVTIASDGSHGTHIGQEADLQAQWSIASHTLADIAFGHIFPGAFLRNAGRGSPYNCFFLGVTQRF